MFFVYDNGCFDFHIESNRCCESELIDKISFFDLDHINYLCEHFEVKFPYEINLDTITLLNAYFTGYFNNSFLCKMFDYRVKNRKIKLYCKEIKK